MASLTWTGESCRNAGLLYASYRDRAEVRDDAGTVIGEVLHLTSGRFSPRVPGLMDEACSTADEAVASVARMHDRFRR